MKTIQNNNDYKLANSLIDIIPLRVVTHELEKYIGRYVILKNYTYKLIQQIIAIQKHWGYVDGEYISNKVGFRVVEVGNQKDFGRVGDIDNIEFVNITELKALNINKKINDNNPDWFAEVKIDKNIV